MSKRGNDELMEDISEATWRLEIYSQNMEYGAFLEDIKTQDAVIRNFEIIVKQQKTSQMISKKSIRIFHGRI